MAGFEFLRSSETPQINPPRRPNGLACDTEPGTVILQFGKGAQGRIINFNYSHSVKLYMTKQQKELDQ